MAMRNPNLGEAGERQAGGVVLAARKDAIAGGANGERAHEAAPGSGSSIECAHEAAPAGESSGERARERTGASSHGTAPVEEVRLFGYARVSSRDQNLARQIDALAAFGVPAANVFCDKASGRDFGRPGWRALLAALRPGDVVVVASVDRIGRDYAETLEQWRGLTHGLHAAVVVLDMPLLDTRQGPCGLTGEFVADLVLQVLSCVAQVEREHILERQAQGIASARARGVHLGRPRKERPEQYAAASEAYRAGRLTRAQAAGLCGCGVTTFDKWLREDAAAETDGELCVELGNGAGVSAEAGATKGGPGAAASGATSGGKAGIATNGGAGKGREGQPIAPSGGAGDESGNVCVGPVDNDAQRVEANGGVPLCLAAAPQPDAKHVGAPRCTNLFAGNMFAKGDSNAPGVKRQGSYITDACQKLALHDAGRISKLSAGAGASDAGNPGATASNCW